MRQKKKPKINLVSSSESFDDHSSIAEDKSIKNKKRSLSNKLDVVSPKKLKVNEKQSENSWFLVIFLNGEESLLNQILKSQLNY